MGSLFTPCEGGVFAVEEQCHTSDRVVALSVDGFINTVPVTGFALDLTTNHQFLHTLDEFIYVYSFGDRMGTLTMSGIAFTECNATSGLGSPGDLYKYYMDNRLSSSLKPVTIQIANKPTLLGFLTGIKMEIPNPTYPIVQWALQYNVILSSPPPAAGRIAAPRRPFD